MSFRDIGELASRGPSRYGAARSRARERPLSWEERSSKPRAAMAVPNSRSLGFASDDTEGMTAIFRIISTSVSSWRVASGADLRPMPDRVLIYDDSKFDRIIAARRSLGVKVIDELYNAVVHGTLRSQRRWALRHDRSMSCAVASANERARSR